MTEENDTINLMDLAADGGGPDGAYTPALAAIPIKQDLVPLIPFTMSATRVWLHYCPEPELRGNVLCVGESECVLCKVGRKRDERRLLPMYHPIEQRVGVVFVTPSMQPKALLPQLLAHVKRAESDERRIVLFVRRLLDNVFFDVSAAPLRDGEDDGAGAIKQYQRDVDAGRLNPRTVVQQLSADQLRAVSSIARMLELREGGSR